MREIIFKDDSGSAIDLEEIPESSNEGTLEDTSSQLKEANLVDPIENSLPIFRSSRVIMPREFYGFHSTTDGYTFISDRTLVNLEEPGNYKE